MKEIIKNILKKIDYRLVKISKNKSSFDILLDLSNKYNIETVLDVGANTGQFANTLRKNGYKNKIISFEPNSKIYDHLLKNSQRDKNWQIFKQCALGDFDGKIDLNISSYSPSTSILNFTNAHKMAKPEAKMVDTEKVNIFKLDSLSEELNLQNDNLLLKIDTQGYESNIIKGANEILNKIKILFCEISFIELYENQELWVDIIKLINSKGFYICSIENGFFDKESNELLQADIIFIKK